MLGLGYLISGNSCRKRAISVAWALLDMVTCQQEYLHLAMETGTDDGHSDYWL